MSPLREFRSLTTRFEEDIKIEPLRRYYLIFEGANTERKYFQGIDNNRKELGINSQIELVILHKEGDISSFSHPIKLLELIEEKKKSLKRDGRFDKAIDRFVIVFDRDSYENSEDYIEFIEKASTDNILTVASPCFELWLILHYEVAVEKHIVPNTESLFENKKVSNSHTFASRLFSEMSGTNPKSGSFFNKLKGGIDLAIEQEKSLEQDILRMATEIGSNVGALIETFATTSDKTSKVFGMEKEELARKSVNTLLKNQGIYNGLLSVLILLATFVLVSKTAIMILMGYIILVALYGSITSNPKIILMQGGIAIAALLSCFFG